MDNKLTDKLWLTAYGLHGTLNMTELCRLMIYAMFVKYIDLEKSRDGGIELPSYDEKYSVNYLSLIYGKIILKKDLVDYIKKLDRDLKINHIKKSEGDLTIKDDIISEELESLLEKADDEHVKKIFTAIDEAGFQDGSQLYEAASMLLEKLSYQYGNLRNSTFSSLSLCRLEGRLLDCRSGMTVYDGFCGNGLSASVAVDGKCSVYLQDMDKSAASTACVISLLKGNRIGNVKCGDSLINPISLEKYDRVVCEPPFITKYDDKYRSSIPKENFIDPDISDDASIALRHALAHLADDGTAVVLVPMSVIVNYRSTEIRKKLIETYLDAVIELPTGASPNAGPASALLVLKKDTGRKSIYMMDSTSFFEKGEKKQLVINNENIDRIYEMYKRREESEGISIDLKNIKIENSKNSLSASQYVSDKRNTTGDTSAYLKEYRKLVRELEEIDGRLEKLRGRFVISGDSKESWK